MLAVLPLQQTEHLLKVDVVARLGSVAEAKYEVVASIVQCIHFSVSFCPPVLKCATARIAISTN